MSDKETSAEIATIAGRVLNLHPEDANEEWYKNLLSDAKRLAGSALSQREIVQAQVDGDDIFVLGEQHEVIPVPVERVSELRGLINDIFGRDEPAPRVESNFCFYVDGYTLSAVVDEPTKIAITSPDGVYVKIKTSQLTAFLERRLSPPNEGTDD